MRVQNLTEGSKIYTSNVYLVTGSWYMLEDANTLIDVGRDPSIVPKIMNANTGVGKHKIDKVVLTHSHFDHAEMTDEIKSTFKAEIMAFSPSFHKADKVLKDGEIIKIGDGSFEVIHTPGHSNDSICLYNKREKLLFAGDSPLIIKSKDYSFDQSFISVLEKLVELDIETIYFGHGNPLIVGCKEVLKHSISCIKAPKYYKQGA